MEPNRHFIGKKSRSASKKKFFFSVTFFFSNPCYSLNFYFHPTYPYIFWKPSSRRTLCARLPTFLLIFWKIWSKSFFLTLTVSYICALFLVRCWVWVETYRVKVVANFISNNFYDICLDSKCLFSEETPKNWARTRWPPHPHHIHPRRTRPDPPSPRSLTTSHLCQNVCGLNSPPFLPPQLPNFLPKSLRVSGFEEF